MGLMEGLVGLVEGRLGGLVVEGLVEGLEGRLGGGVEGLVERIKP